MTSTGHETAVSHHAAPHAAPHAVPHTAPHATAPDAADGTNGPRRSWAPLVLALAAQVLVVLDISVVNTALPSISRDLHLGAGTMQWLITAYLVTSGGGLLLGG